MVKPTLPSEEVLLTRGQVADWKDEFKEALKERDELNSRLRHLEQLIGAAKLLMGSQGELHQAPALPEQTEDHDDAEDDDGGTFPDAIARILEDAGKPLDHKAIRSALELDPTHGPRLKASPNYYYTAIQRLRKRGKIARTRGKFRIPPAKPETPGSKEPGASDHQGDEGGSSSSSGKSGNGTAWPAPPDTSPAQPGE